jgi:hypothetical protein
VAVLPKLVKGFLYGLVIGIFFGLAVYLLTGAAASLGFVTASPTALGGIVFAACIVAGVGMEYAAWIDGQDANGASPKGRPPA